MSLVISGDIKQIMLSPDNDDEGRILKSIQVDDTISVVTKQGSFVEKSNLGYSIDQCRGGYLRAYEKDDCLMIVIQPKKDEPN